MYSMHQRLNRLEYKKGNKNRVYFPFLSSTICINNNAVISSDINLILLFSYDIKYILLTLLVERCCFYRANSLSRTSY